MNIGYADGGGEGPLGDGAPRGFKFGADRAGAGGVDHEVVGEREGALDLVIADVVNETAHGEVDGFVREVGVEAGFVGDGALGVEGRERGVAGEGGPAARLRAGGNRGGGGGVFRQRVGGAEFREDRAEGFAAFEISGCGHDLGAVEILLHFLGADAGGDRPAVRGVEVDGAEERERLRVEAVVGNFDGEEVRDGAVDVAAGAGVGEPRAGRPRARGAGGGGETDFLVERGLRLRDLRIEIGWEDEVVAVGAHLPIGVTRRRGEPADAGVERGLERDAAEVGVGLALAVAGDGVERATERDERLCAVAEAAAENLKGEFAGGGRAKAHARGDSGGLLVVDGAAERGVGDVAVTFAEGGGDRSVGAARDECGGAGVVIREAGAEFAGEGIRGGRRGGVERVEDDHAAGAGAAERGGLRAAVHGGGGETEEAGRIREAAAEREVVEINGDRRIAEIRCVGKTAQREQIAEGAGAAGVDVEIGDATGETAERLCGGRRDRVEPDAGHAGGVGGDARLFDEQRVAANDRVGVGVRGRGGAGLGERGKRGREESEGERQAAGANHGKGLGEGFDAIAQTKFRPAEKGRGGARCPHRVGFRTGEARTQVARERARGEQPVGTTGSTKKAGRGSGRPGEPHAKACGYRFDGG